MLFDAKFIVGELKLDCAGKLNKNAGIMPRQLCISNNIPVRKKTPNEYEHIYTNFTSKSHKLYSAIYIVLFKLQITHPLLYKNMLKAFMNKKLPTAQSLCCFVNNVSGKRTIKTYKKPDHSTFKENWMSDSGTYPIMAIINFAGVLVCWRLVHSNNHVHVDAIEH
jgi:hypothetical protein